MLLLKDRLISVSSLVCFSDFRGGFRYLLENRIFCLNPWPSSVTLLITGIAREILEIPLPFRSLPTSYMLVDVPFNFMRMDLLMSSLTKIRSDKGKGKFVSVRAVKVCRGRRRLTPLILKLRSTWRWVTILTPRLLCCPGKTSVAVEREGVWAPEMVNRMAVAGFRARTAKALAVVYTDWAIAAALYYVR